ncbi:MAG TPA: hypothetical protein VI197_27915 [Polyangiaceae bacterium]
MAPLRRPPLRLARFFWLLVACGAALHCSEVAEVLTPPAAGGSGGSTSTLDVTGSGGSASTDSTNGGAGTLTNSVTASGGSGAADSTSGAGGADPGNGVVMLDAGVDHSCAVIEGALYCWGDNQRGRLGVGDTENRSTPVPVGSLRSWAQVTTGNDHSCARRDDGTVLCFGANDLGQLGVPGVNDVLSPIPVTLPSAAVEIAAESDFTCAVLADGSLHCWGENTEGMLGQDDTYPGDPAFLPLRVGTADDWSSVDTGQGHACGLREPGSLWCWGRNTDYQLGLGEDAGEQYRSPQQVGDETDWTQVQAGQNHACGLKASGELRCWGDGQFGALGTGDRDHRPSPARVDERQYNQVSLDTFHTCAIDSGADLWCWGRNAEGQLGLGDTEDRVLPTRIAAGGWAQVAVGRFYTCAQKLDGSTWCTGANEVGQLGVGDTERRSEFTSVDWSD